MLIAILRFVVWTIIGVFLIDAAVKLLTTSKNIVVRKTKRIRNRREATQTV